MRITQNRRPTVHPSFCVWTSVPRRTALPARQPKEYTEGLRGYDSGQARCPGTVAGQRCDVRRARGSERGEWFDAE